MYSDSLFSTLNIEEALMKQCATIHGISDLLL